MALISANLCELENDNKSSKINIWLIIIAFELRARLGRM